MLNEVHEIKTNTSKVKDVGVPNIPVLMFSSNGEGTGCNEDVRRSHQQSYIEKVEYGDKINLDCSHYVYDIKYEK